jgi:signal transduction histidine kinase
LLVDPVDDDWMERHSRDPEELTLLQQLRPRAFLITPLPGRDRVIGALSIGVSSPDRTLPADLGEAAEALASVAGLELTNALLFQTAEQALIGRDRVLEIVAHDLRNLSSAARMCAIALEADPDAEASVRAELYSTIRESSDAIHRLVGDLLDLAAIDLGRLTVSPMRAAPAAIVAAAAGLFRERANAAGITLTTEMADDLPEVLLDRDRMIQALANLVHNALKFTPAGGRIALGATATPESVVIHVSDTGSGMPAATLTAVLRAEWRAQAGPGGSGLGLPITRGIVAAHGGTIEGTSTPGQGTTFRLVLPR